MGGIASLLLCLFISAQRIEIASALKFGINYGQIANNLPAPTQVVSLLQSMNVNRVKLYDADPNVLSAFSGSNIEFIISVSNGNMSAMTDSSQAQAWVAEHVQPYIAGTRITCILVGNEVLTGDSTSDKSNLLPAMKSLYQALTNLGLQNQVNVSTAHKLDILATSYPPSSGAFREDLSSYLQPLLNFLSQINSPFLINAYPFFAYSGDPNSISLPYALFESNAGQIDSNTNLTYDNMLYAQIDAVYSAMKAMGHTDISVAVSETGWPSKGDTNEVGASVENAAAYNGNLLKRVSMNEGTPHKPDVPVDVHVFALFNEDSKPGATSERNYGLFYPNGTAVYDIGLQNTGSSGSPAGTYFTSSSLQSSTSKLMISYGMGILVLVVSIFF